MHTPVLEKEIKRQYLFELYLHILLSLDVVSIHSISAMYVNVR